MEAWPGVSVVMPIRNEARHIPSCLTAMLAQDYAGDIEVIAIDGASTDGTAEALAKIAETDSRLRVLDNPLGVATVAMNLGVAAAKYDLIIQMDGHTIPQPDYVRRSVEIRARTGAANVGGRRDIEADGHVSGAIAAALESPFGAGPATWRHGRTEAVTDTVPLGCFDRTQLIEIGGFNEHLVRNQDYELNYRLRAAGGSVVFSPEIVSASRSRLTLWGLIYQYLFYGFWKSRVIAMHPRSAKPRHFIAPAFVLFLLLLPLMAVLGPPWTLIATGVLATYGGLNVIFSLRQASRRGWRFLPLIPLIFALLHVTWGLGFLSGVARWWGFTGSAARRISAHASASSNVNNLIRRRDLLRELVKSLLKSTTAASRLGWLWWLVDPLVMMLVFWFLIVGVLGRGTGYEPYPVFLLCGLLCWRHVQSSVITASNVLVKRSNVIRAVAFPTALLPLADVLADLVRFALGCLILILATLLMATPHHSGEWWWALQALPMMVLQTGIIAGLALAIAPYGVFYRDLPHLLPHVFRVGFYLSPTLFSADLIRNMLHKVFDPALATLLFDVYMLNPFAMLIEGYRLSFVYGAAMPLQWWLVLTLECAVALLVGYRIYQRHDRRVIKFI